MKPIVFFGALGSSRTGRSCSLHEARLLRGDYAACPPLTARFILERLRFDDCVGIFVLS